MNNILRATLYLEHGIPYVKDKMSNQITEIVIVIFGLFILILIDLFESVVRIFNPKYSIWFDWIDKE